MSRLPASARMRGCARFGAGALVTRTIHDWSDQQRPEGESGDPEEFHAGEESKRHAQWQPHRGIVGTGVAQRRYGVAAPARNPGMFPLISAPAHAVLSCANKLRKQKPPSRGRSARGNNAGTDLIRRWRCSGSPRQPIGPASASSLSSPRNQRCSSRCYVS